MKLGPIIVIDDDPDDKEILDSVFNELNVSNKIIWFDNCDEASIYLINSAEQPFVIFCDVNMPGLTGIEFKRQVDEHPQLRKKSIPFVFYSTAVDQKTVDKAYTEMMVQGFFEKKESNEKVKTTVKLILDYWHECRHPNS